MKVRCITLGAFQVNTWVAALMATGLILGASYMLFLYRRVVFGKIENEDVRAMQDITGREIAMFAPLVVVVLSSLEDSSPPDAPQAVANTRDKTATRARTTTPSLRIQFCKNATNGFSQRKCSSATPPGARIR